MARAFISYSHTDEHYVKRLQVHLSQIQREGLLDTWYDRELLPGDPIDQTIDENLRESDIFIAIVSPDFIASDYCYSKEMNTAFSLQEERNIRVVAVIVEPCDWRNTPLADNLVLPQDGKEVSSFTNENAAFLQVIDGIRRVIKRKTDAEDAVELQAPASNEIGSAMHPRSRTRFRSKKVFDDLDRSEFRDRAFE